MTTSAIVPKAAHLSVCLRFLFFLSLLHHDGLKRVENEIANCCLYIISDVYYSVAFENYAVSFFGFG